jgi:class 3 adenylate cyclase
MTAAAPSGVVTFLFTDVEGSTRRWENDADGMRVALAAHDEVLRSAIEAHGGWWFKHTGDGVRGLVTDAEWVVHCARGLCHRAGGGSYGAGIGSRELPGLIDEPFCGAGSPAKRCLIQVIEWGSQK